MMVYQMNLENRFFYRFVKALHVFFLIIAFLISLGIINIAGLWWGILWAGIFYAFLSITKEALIYVAFGKKMSWAWITFYTNNHVKND
jgi:hypothetical protein